MPKRFVSIWFRYLLTDGTTINRPELKKVPFVLSAPHHGRILVTAANHLAAAQGITPQMPVADARAILNGLQVYDDEPGFAAASLKSLGEWCIRFAPIVAIDLPDGLIMDVSGCTHLWGGEAQYLKELTNKLTAKGYNARAAMADTIGAAWALARYGSDKLIVEPGEQLNALLPLSPAALRLELLIVDRLQKLGLRTIKSFIGMPRSVLRRRFGDGLLQRLHQALGIEDEPIQALQLPALYEERLPCLEPIATATGIEIGLQKLLETLCRRLQQEGKGIRKAVFKGYRIDGEMQEISIGTNHASHSIKHLFALFELRISSIEPGLGIELFILEATQVEDVPHAQEALWADGPGLDDPGVTELLDRLAGKVGLQAIHRYLPDEHYWPERSLKLAASIQEKPASPWPTGKARPVHLLAVPEPVEVTAPIPDYPPMLFIYKGKRHEIKKADGPERIEREWWLDTGEHRDYYYVEDENGQRYWLFRSGHYSGSKPKQWFIHGFFA